MIVKKNKICIHREYLTYINPEKTLYQSYHKSGRHINFNDNVNDIVYTYYMFIS